MRGLRDKGCRDEFYRGLGEVRKQLCRLDGAVIFIKLGHKPAPSGSREFSFEI